jgi:hypothetical protein
MSPGLNDTPFRKKGDAATFFQFTFGFKAEKVKITQKGQWYPYLSADKDLIGIAKMIVYPGNGGDKPRNPTGKMRNIKAFFPTKIFSNPKEEIDLCPREKLSEFGYAPYMI